MDELIKSNDLNQEQNPSVVPAPPEGYSGVWPPPINYGRGLPGEPEIVAPFKFLYMKVKTKGKLNIADFRDGNIGFSREGITLDGRVQPRSEIYTPVVIVCFILGRVILGYIAHAIMRYGCLRAERLVVPWADVSQIILVPKKSQIGIAYSAANFKGDIKPYTLAMNFPPADYHTLAEVATQYAPQLTIEGKLVAGTSRAMIRLLILLVIVIIGIVGAALSSHH